MRVDGELSNSFAIGGGARKGCVMLQWLFNIFMDGCMWEMKTKVGNGVDWSEVACLHMSERGATRGGGLEQAKRECLDRERWRLFCCSHPLGGHSQKEWGVRALDR